MLSFMQDDEQQKLNSNDKKNSTDKSAPSSQNEQLSSEADYLVPAEHGKNVKQGTVILTILFTIGALCVWFMIKKTTPSSTSAAVSPEEQQITEALAQLTGIRSELTTKVDDIIGKFNQITDVEQVGVFELKKNPFRQDLIITGEVEIDADQELIMKKQEVKKQSDMLKLWSIMESPQGSCCMINDKILYVGDSVGGFTVTRIADKFVDVTSNGITVQLKMLE